MGIPEPAENDPRAFLVVEDETAAIGGRSFLQLRVVLDEAVDVISLPHTAVNTVGERSFIFVMEDGVRTIREVELGLVGNLGVEIVSGVVEGEIVVIG